MEQKLYCCNVCSNIIQGMRTNAETTYFGIGLSHPSIGKMSILPVEKSSIHLCNDCVKQLAELLPTITQAKTETTS